MRSESNPQGRLFEEFLALAYLGHPYGQPTIGHRSDIEAYSRIDAYDFYEKHYGARNMVIAVVGDVYRDELEKLADKYFSEIPPGNGGVHVRTVEPVQRGERRVVLEDPAQPFLLVGYHIPDARHPDMPAISALADILGQGRSSRLYSSLVKESQTALFTGSFVGLPGDRFPSLLVALGVPNSGVDPLDMEQAIYDEIERIKTEGITAEELTGYKNRARAEFIQGLRGMMGMSGNIAIAAQLCYAEEVLGDWHELFRALDDIDAVTLEDVQRVADEYLVKSNRSVGMIVTEKQDS